MYMENENIGLSAMPRHQRVSRPRAFTPRTEIAPHIPRYRYRASPVTMGGMDYDEGLDGFFSRINPINVVRRQAQVVRQVAAKVNPVAVVRQQVQVAKKAASSAARGARQMASSTASTVRHAASSVVAAAKKAKEAEKKLAMHKANVMRQLATKKAADVMRVVSKVKGGGGSAELQTVKPMSEQPAEPVVEDTSYPIEDTGYPMDQYVEPEPIITDANSYPFEVQMSPESFNGGSSVAEPTITDASSYPYDVTAAEPTGGDVYEPEQPYYEGEQTFYEGEQNMEMDNVPSDAMLPAPSSFEESGMGNIWSDLMTTGLEISKQRTNVSIAQSQAAQADALARADAARAAAIAASQQKPKMPVPLMLGAAAGLGLLLVLLRKRRA